MLNSTSSGDGGRGDDLFEIVAAKWHPSLARMHLKKSGFVPKEESSGREAIVKQISNTHFYPFKTPHSSEYWCLWFWYFLLPLVIYALHFWNLCAQPEGFLRELFAGDSAFI